MSGWRRGLLMVQKRQIAVENFSSYHSPECPAYQFIASQKEHLHEEITAVRRLSQFLPLPNQVSADCWLLGDMWQQSRPVQEDLALTTLLGGVHNRPKGRCDGLAGCCVNTTRESKQDSLQKTCSQQQLGFLTYYTEDFCYLDFTTKNKIGEHVKIDAILSSLNLAEITQSIGLYGPWSDAIISPLTIIHKALVDI